MVVAGVVTGGNSERYTCSRRTVVSFLVARLSICVHGVEAVRDTEREVECVDTDGDSVIHCCEYGLVALLSVIIVLGEDLEEHQLCVIGAAEYTLCVLDAHRTRRIERTHVTGRYTGYVCAVRARIAVPYFKVAVHVVDCKREFVVVIEITVQNSCLYVIGEAHLFTLMEPAAPSGCEQVQAVLVGVQYFQHCFLSPEVARFRRYDLGIHVVEQLMCMAERRVKYGNDLTRAGITLIPCRLETHLFNGADVGQRRCTGIKGIRYLCFIPTVVIRI